MTISKTKVKQAGEVLKTNAKDEKAMYILSEWRSLHTTPLATFQALAYNKIKALKLKETIVARRLKRTPSIIRKLQRWSSMDLARMQDIGGIRIVVKSVKDVYRLHESLRSGKQLHEPIIPEKDYISKPKDDGYRSLHQVFKYKSKTHTNLVGLQIELQIRTHLQHYWATAVETMGILTKSSLKTGEGEEDIKTFFKLASALFSYKEKQPILEEYQNTSIEEIAKTFTDLERELKIFNKLEGLTLLPYVETSKKAEYYLVELSLKEKPQLITIPFTKSQLSFAEQLYRLREVDTVDDPYVELVLISVKEFKNLKRAYPNYFLDTQNFIKELKVMCNTILTNKVY